MPKFDGLEKKIAEAERNHFIEIGLLSLPVLILLLVACVKGGLIYSFGWILIPAALWMTALLIARKVTNSLLGQRVIYAVLAIGILYWFWP
jgi:hypothetical protein